MAPLDGWQTFYEIVGSSAGALIGLQFVAISLIAARPVGKPSADTADAFATPTIIHFATVLGFAALVSAPWESAGAVAILFGVFGLGGLIYSAIVTRRMRAQTAYKPEFEDWLFHCLLPIVAYGVLAGSACAAPTNLRYAMFGPAAAVLLLLLVGIHNTWDAVTYHIFTRPLPDEK